MKLSDQQQDVVGSAGDLVVNAVAGSGKTSTLVEYARGRNKSRMLYLAFNRSVKNEAKAKFREKGISNVHVETAHSLALKYFRGRNIEIKKSSYTAYDAKSILGFRHKDIITDIKFGRHLVNMVACFCNSNKHKVSELDYPSFLSNGKETEFVNKYYDELIQKTRLFLSKMKNGEIEMEHDYYLKEYQLQQPTLRQYDCILFDEGQDASPVMLDVFLNQPVTKVIVGDEHQQIYSWRYAVNAMREVKFDRKCLNTSYRFDNEVAALARQVLATKSLLDDFVPPKIHGAGKQTAIMNRAILGRSNAAVLVEAIEKLIENGEIKSVYFEGNFNSYTYADEGGSVYDVLNLYLDKRRLIRDPLVKSFTDFGALEEYADDTGDALMKGIIEIVKKYQKDLPKLIREIKDHHVPDEKKHEADMIFSTVHKAKGMEYDEVTLLNDFLGEEKLQKLLEREDLDLSPEKLQEDINILYVAVTRTKNKLVIPEALVPFSFDGSACKNIEILASEEEDDDEVPVVDFRSEMLRTKSEALETAKAYSHESIRTKHKDAYKKWTQNEDDQLEVMFCERTPLKDLASHFGRTKGAINSRIKKLELREKYFDAG